MKLTVNFVVPSGEPPLVLNVNKTCVNIKFIRTRIIEQRPFLAPYFIRLVFKGKEVFDSIPCENNENLIAVAMSKLYR
jgi:hypothetical protein